MRKNFLLLLFISVTILFKQIPAQSAANYDWMNYGFNIGLGDYLSNVVLDIDSKGNLINAGSFTAYTDYFYTHKISSSGNLIWKMDNPGRQEGKILDLIVDEMDNIYVTGYYFTVFPDTEIDTLFIKKIISVGNTPQMDWEYRHLIGDDYMNIANREFKLIKYDSSIVVTGISLNRGALADIVTIKLDTNGTELWKKFYTNGENYDVSPKDIAVDKDDNIFIYGNSVVGRSSTLQLIKYNSEGDLLWSKTIANPDDRNISAADIEIVGDSPWISANSQGVTFLIKYDSQGNNIKEIKRETSGVNLGISIDELQNVYQICNDSIFKYDTSGNLLSSTDLPSIANVSYYSFDVDADQNIYVVGKKSHFYTAKINQNLEIEAVVETTWQHPPNAHYDISTPYDIAVSSTFGVFISGEIETYDFINSNTHAGQVTVKYSQLPTVVNENEIRPNSFYLSQNYPNPFNPSTTIQYYIPMVEALSEVEGQVNNSNYSQLLDVTLKVYDVLGREVTVLVNNTKPVGTYTVEFDATGLSSGVYFYRIMTGSFADTKKMILMR